MRLAGLLSLTVALSLSGCSKTVDNPAGHVQRGKERLINQNDLGQLALFYINYSIEMNRSPASLEELKEYMQKEAPKIIQSIEQGHITVVYKAKVSSNVVLAYESKPDLNGNQLAAMGDKSVKQLPAAELQKALQVKE